MTRFIVLFLFVVAFVTADAQVRLRLNYDKKWMITSSDSSVYIRVGIYDTTNARFAGPISDLYLSGKPQMTGMYSDSKKVGEFTFYYENGQVESKGLFDDDKRSGIWTYYYPNGKLKHEIEFSTLGYEPKLITSNDADGNPVITSGTGQWKEIVELPNGDEVTISGNYLHGWKDGKWRQESASGDIKITETYASGDLVRQNSYQSGNYSLRLPVKFSKTETFSATKIATFEMYPALRLMLINGKLKGKPVEPGKESLTTVYMAVDEQPEVVGGFQARIQVIAKNIKYPSVARRLGVTGSVYIEFVVQADGSVRGTKVKRGVGSGCDEEALRVIDLMNNTLKWNPGKLNGVPVNVRFVMPIKFLLD